MRRLTYFVLLRGSFQDSGACKRPYSIRKFNMFFSAFLFKSTQMKRRNCSTLFSFSIIAYFSRACLVYNDGKEWEFSIYGQKSPKFDPSLRALCPILFTFGNVTLTRGFCDAGYLHNIENKIYLQPYRPRFNPFIKTIPAESSRNRKQ